MTNLKKFFAVALLAMGVAAPAMAQESDGKDYKPFPHMFIGVQGGGQTTFTNYDNSKLITPTASLSFGSFFTPVVGARLHVNGAWNKGGLHYTDINGTQVDMGKYKYNYVTTDLDLLINMVTLFGKKDYYPVNLYLIGGIGLNTAFNNDDAYAMKDVMPFAWDGKRLSHNARVGAMLDVNLCKNVSLNLEVAANSLSDRYNSKIADKDDWQLTAQLGLAFKFGFKKKPAPVEEWATRIDTIWYDDIAYAPRVEDGTATWNVFYEIRESEFEANSQLQAIGSFLKDYRDCKITIKSYADRGTGNPKINMGYSKQRSDKAVKALTDAGVNPSAIVSAEYFGDTVQPFEENDKNRVTIITATGLKDVKDKYTVKKFRTEEVRYRVK